MKVTVENEMESAFSVANISHPFKIMTSTLIHLENAQKLFTF